MLEKVQYFACKRLLNVLPQTPNKMVLGDLGRLPVFVSSAVKCVKFWHRVANLPENRLPGKVYKMLLYLQEQGRHTWALSIKQMLFTNGFGYVWEQQNVGDFRLFLRTFKERLSDQYKQAWSSDIQTKERYEFYCSFKTIFQSERYLEYDQKRCFRNGYIKFRFGCSPINTHAFRYHKDVPPHKLLCPVCKAEIETEAHILFDCRAYNELRTSVASLTTISGNTNSDVTDVTAEIMSMDDEKTVIQLLRFLYDVFQKREQYV